MRLFLTALTMITLSTAFAAPVQLEATDGTQLTADIEGTGERAVLLLHAADRSAADWKDIVGTLAEKGFRVAALDLRGHGRSGGSLDEAGYAAMTADVAAAIAKLREGGATSVALVGAELGGVLAMEAAAQDASIGRVMVLSPRLSANGHRLSSALAAWGSRPLVLVVGDTDTTGVRAGGAIEAKVGTSARLDVIEQGTHGTHLFRQSGTLLGTLVAWLSEDREVPEPIDTRALQTGDVTSLETTGARIGEE